jgi:hypothetical protein
MTDWPTSDEVIDAWAGTGAPHEPSPTVHPSMMRPVWDAHQGRDGRWTFTRDGRVVWRDITGHPDAAAMLLAEMRRQDLPPGAWRETTGVERPVRRAAPPVDHRWVEAMAWTLIGGYLCVVGAVFVIGLHQAFELVVAGRL